MMMHDEWLRQAPDYVIPTGRVSPALVDLLIAWLRELS